MGLWPATGYNNAWIPAHAGMTRMEGRRQVGTSCPRKRGSTGVLTLLGGLFGIFLAYGLSVAIGTLPLYGPLYEDTSGKGDIHLYISVGTVMVSTASLIFVGVLSGIVPAIRASHLNPVEALRYE